MKRKLDASLPACERAVTRRRAAGAAGRLALGLFGICVVLLAADRPRDIVALVDTTSGAPPELSADILLRLVESNLIREDAWRRELIERAFFSAAGARHPMPVRGAPGITAASSTDVVALRMSLDLGFDTLSLRCRAVSQMIRLDPGAALALFDEIPQPRFPALSCKDAVVYSSGPYYSLASHLFDTAFSRKDRAEGKHLAFLEDRIRNMSSPLDLEPAVDMLLRAKVSGEDFERLVTAYGTMLKDLTGDARSLSSAVNYSLYQRYTELGKAAQQQNLNVFALVEGYRAFFVAYASGPRCGELAEGENGATVVPSIARFFDDSLRKSLGPAGEAIPPISGKETTPSVIQGKAEIFHYWEKPATKQLWENYKKFSLGSKEQQARRQPGAGTRRITNPLTVEERSTPEWEAELRAFLDKLEEWKSKPYEREIDFFHQLSLLYLALLDIVPPGPLQDRVIEDSLLHLAQSPVKRSDPPQWCLRVRSLFRLLRENAKTEARLVEELRRGKDPVMAAYAALEHLTRARAPGVH